jgi:multidrug efflux system membrane fusion protein
MITRSYALVLAASLAAASLACARRPTEKPSRPVRVENVTTEVPAMGLRYSAAIQPYEQVQLAFKVGGYVRDVRQVRDAGGRPRNLQQGDPVARGTVLARVDPADYQEKVNQAKAQLAEAEASLARVRADAARAESLYKDQALTRPEYDAATSGLAGATARVDAARAQLEAAQLALKDATLVAPADGVVLSRNIEVGSLAGMGTVGFVLADLTRVKAVFGVPDLLVQRVRIGTALRVTTDAYGSAEFPGEVTAVSPAADTQSRVFSVEVTIPNPDGRLKAGMIGKVEVAAQHLPDIPPGSPTVSVSAIVTSSRGGAYAVFVVEGPDDAATARARDVTLGPISGNRVAVASGLKVGDRVVVTGASLLVDGDRLRVIPGEGE